MPKGRPSDRPPDPGRILQIKPTHVLRTPSPSVLPLQLQGEVPPCSQQCLATSVDEGYNCADHGIACLCRSYSSQGFTLGELAYLCLNQSCKQTSRSQSLAQYNICDNVSGAVPATHAVLTADPTRPTKPPTSTSNRRTPAPDTTSQPVTRSLNRSSSVTTSNTGPRRDSSTSVMDSPTGRASHTPSSEPAAAPDSTQTTTHSGRISTGAVVGIAFGVFALIALIAAAMYFFFCIRRRKTNQKDDEQVNFFSRFRHRRPSQDDDEESYDFVDKGPPRLSPLLTIKPANDIHVPARDTVACWQQLSSSPAQQQQNVVDIAVQRGKTGDREKAMTVAQPTLSSDPSAAQTPAARTNSDEAVPPLPKTQRVPSPPEWRGLGLPPNPKAAQYSPKVRPSTPEPPPSTIQVLPPPQPEEWPLSSTKAEFAEKSLPKSTPLAVPTPMAMYDRPAMPTPPPIMLPTAQSAAAWPYSEQPMSAVSNSRSRDSSGSLLNYYASSEAGIVPSPLFLESPYAFDRNNSTPPAKRFEMVTSKDRDRSAPFRKDSAGSDTSFESSDEDETAQAPALGSEIARHLSPVPESSPPLRRSPIAGITYPSIPKSASRTPYQPLGHRAHQASFPQSPRTPKAWHESPTDQRPPPPRQYQQQQLPLPTTTNADRRISDQSILSGSTLVEKRRGKKKAHGLELSLEKEESAYTPFQKADPRISREIRDNNVRRPNTRTRQQESPLRDCERMPSRKHGSKKKTPRRRDPQELTEESPTWNQNLTPSRKGDDLYLQFGVASPMQANF